MYERFWNRFSADYRANCLAWKHGEAAALPPHGDGWQAVWTANPDLLRLDDRLLLYYRASGYAPGREGAHDRIGVAEVLEIGLGRLEVRNLNLGEPIVDVGDEEEFDGTDVLDPATVVFGGKVFLYYSAIGPGVDSVGLAVSDDGEHFTKVGRLMTGRAPDVVVYQDRLRMVYQRPDEAGNYLVYLAESTDGLTFSDVQPEPVFDPPRENWDGLSIATVRLGVEGEWFYALYGGSAYLADEPDYFGLARSQDLASWEFHPGNPIFGCGPKGAIDGGAMWFPAIHETDEHFVLLYEGSPGKYTFDLNSAICMATISK